MVDKKGEIERLVALLDNNDINVRKQAMQELGCAGSVEAIPALIEALRPDYLYSENCWIPVTRVEYVPEWDDYDVIDDLCSPHEYLRNTVVESLINITRFSMEPVHALLRALTFAEYDHYRVWEILRKIAANDHSGRVLEALEEALKHRDKQVSFRAAEFLFSLHKRGNTSQRQRAEELLTISHSENQKLTEYIAELFEEDELFRKEQRAPKMTDLHDNAYARSYHEEEEEDEEKRGLQDFLEYIQNH